MPELPEVETVRRALVPACEGREIASAYVGRPDLRWPLPENLATRLTGRTFMSLSRRGKFILARLDGHESLLLHLGMSGSIRIHDHRPDMVGKHDHVILEMAPPKLADGASANALANASAGASAGPCWVVFNDPRRFGWIDLFAGDTHPMVADMGPEPLGNLFSEDYLAAALDRRTGPIKTALLNQQIVAGIGNIYACEALFYAGLSPRRKAGTIRGARAARLVQSIREVLLRAIDEGGTSLRDHVQPGGEIGYFVQKLAVYGRAGEPCPACATPVRMLTQSGRSSFYCPTCQR